MFLCNFVGLRATHEFDHRPFDGGSDSFAATEEGDLPAGRRNNVSAINAGIGAGIGLLAAAPLALFSLPVCLAVAGVTTVAGAVVGGRQSQAAAVGSVLGERGVRR